MHLGDTEFTAEEIESLFSESSSQETPPEDKQEETTASEQPTDNQDKGGEKVDATKAFAKRLRESTDKARSEEREAIAKQLGFESYAEMMKDKERKQIEEKGFDPDQISSLVDDLYKQRRDADPVMQELEGYRKQQVKAFAEKELAEISKLTNGEITNLNQLPKEVIDLWTKNGSLKSAFLQVKGEELITKARAEQSKGTTQHLNNPSGGSTIQTSTRPFTEEEKRIYRQFNPTVTDEQLNKMTKKIL